MKAKKTNHKTTKTRGSKITKDHLTHPWLLFFVGLIISAAAAWLLVQSMQEEITQMFLNFL